MNRYTEPLDGSIPVRIKYEYTPKTFILLSLFNEISFQSHLLVTNKPKDCSGETGDALDQCEYYKKFDELNYQEKVDNIPQNDGKVVECTEEDCSLGYFVFNKPEYTIDRVIELLQ